MPQPGEKLVCLRNNHEKGLLNGSLWTCVRCKKYTKTKLTMTVVPEEGGLEITVLAHAPYFTWYGNTDWEDPDWKPGMARRLRRTWVNMLQEDEKSIGFEMREAESFTYGYILTVHKSQGSQWDNVLLIDESGSFGADSRKHLYTGITRAARTITVKNEAQS
jgi:exodeoxyribonuclease-5